MAKLGEQAPRQFLSRRGKRGERAMAGAWLYTVLRDPFPTLEALRAAEQSVAAAGSSIKSQEAGFKTPLRKVKKRIEYRTWMDSRDISQTPPEDYQTVSIAMDTGNFPKPETDLGLTGRITNTDHQLIRHLIGIQSGLHNGELFASYVSALGYAAEANNYAARAERAKLLGLDGEQMYTVRSTKALESATVVYHDINLRSETDVKYANEKDTVSKLFRDLYIAEQEAVDLDPGIETTFDPSDVVNNNLILLRSEVQAHALQELHRKLDRVATKLGTQSTTGKK